MIIDENISCRWQCHRSRIREDWPIYDDSGASAANLDPLCTQHLDRSASKSPAPVYQVINSILKESWHEYLKNFLNF